MPAGPSLRRDALRTVAASLLALAVLGSSYAEDIAPQPAPDSPTVTLPPSCDLERLTELVAQATGVPVQWGAGKVQGNVRLSLPDAVAVKDLWPVYNQLLANQGLTTVVSAVPAIYQIVPLAEAPQTARLLSPEELANLPVVPGYQSVVRYVQHVSADTAVKLLAQVITAPGCVFRILGGDGRSLFISAPTQRIVEMDAVIAALDRAGQAPVVRLVKPERTAPPALQASATAAWSALGRVDDRARAGEIQVAPDGLQLLLVASTDDVDALERLVRALDKSEPVETRSYRPRYFTLDEVSGLIQQTLGTLSKVDIVRDRLTGSLLIKATVAEHQRVAALIASLDEAPTSARRQARALQVKHRKADEMARLLMTLVAAGQTDAAKAGAGGDSTRAAPQPVAQAAEPTASEGSANPSMLSTPSLGGGGIASLPLGGGGGGGNSVSTAPTTATSPDGSLVITADPVTNRLLVLGEPRVIDQMQELLAQVDVRQPQVDLEVTLVSLSDDENRDLGVELLTQFQQGGNQAVVSSLFGQSTAATTGDALGRTIGNASGFGAVVLNPGDYAAVVRALEKINNGRTTIRSQLIIANNAQASLNAVVQQPYSATNSSTQVATTSFGGTSDAGTQLTLSPRISPADYVTLDYAIAQSAFIGSPTVTESGVIPPTKRTDNVASTATVPDGHVIALGGLSNRSEGHSESRIPWLGAIPVVGNLFKTQSDQRQESRFYIFIRANILRHSSFGDLRYSSEKRRGEAGVDSGEPKLEPQFMH